MAPKIPQQVLDIVQYLINADQSKIPIKRTGKCSLLSERLLLTKAFCAVSDIVKHAIPNQSKVFPVLMEQARSCLELAYGIKVLELPERNSYILVTKLTPKVDWSRVPDLPISFNPGVGILIPVLAFIFMSRGSVREGG